MSNITNSLSALFISKVRIKALKYFLFNPDTPIHLRGAVREMREEINAVRRELSRLEEVNLLKSEVRGNRKYFVLNSAYPLLQELLSIFHKSFGLGGAIVNSLAKLGNIKFAVLSSDFIKGMKLNPQSIDLVVVGDVHVNVLTEIVADVEKKLGREINYTVLKETEFQLRKKRKDSFIMDLLFQNRVLLVGNADELIA